MDSETLFSNLDYLGSSGVVLSVEQKAALQSSLVTLKRDSKFHRVKLWGVIKCVQKEYFIVQGVGKNELTDRKSLYSQDCVNWHLLPYATPEMKSKAALLQGRFTGDPSFDYEFSVTHRIGEGEETEETTTVKELKEEERVAGVVATIDEETAVVPQGAYVKGPLGDVTVNRSFQGLCLGDAKRLNYYFHFRTPTADVEENEKTRNCISRSINFLETIDKDIPKGCWSIQCDRGGTFVVLRSLLWLGMVAYHVPQTKNHGYFYCGTGERNSDLHFML